jgi:tetratricopeptide (TPR) repeat protein
VLERALASVRERRIQLSVEAPLQQLLAEAHLGLGQYESAKAECGEAIALARRQGTPLYECDAQLVLAGSLLRESGSHSEAAGEIGAALNRVEELIDQMGAESRRPRLEELRAEHALARGNTDGRDRHLREAHRLFTEMGATGHAERIANELTL